MLLPGPFSEACWTDAFESSLGIEKAQGLGLVDCHPGIPAGLSSEDLWQHESLEILLPSSSQARGLLRIPTYDPDDPLHSPAH